MEALDRLRISDRTASPPQLLVLPCAPVIIDRTNRGGLPVKTSGRKLLDHAGKTSAESAETKAELEYARYRSLLDAQPQRVNADFEKVAKELKKLPRPKKPERPMK